MPFPNLKTLQHELVAGAFRTVSSSYVGFLSYSRSRRCWKVWTIWPMSENRLSLVSVAIFFLVSASIEMSVYDKWFLALYYSTNKISFLKSMVVWKLNFSRYSPLNLDSPDQLWIFFFLMVARGQLSSQYFSQLFLLLARLRRRSCHLITSMVVLCNSLKTSAQNFNYGRTLVGIY
jgi:hypothetical protein